MIFPELHAVDFYDAKDGYFFVYMDTSGSDIDQLADRRDGELSCTQLGFFTLVGAPYWRLMEHLAFQLKKEYNRHPSGRS